MSAGHISDSHYANNSQRTVSERPPNGAHSTTTVLTSSKDFGILVIPRALRYIPGKPFHFSLATNIFFGLGCTLVVSNLYYCQPLLVQISQSFGVTYSDVSEVPTLVQAGYCVGLLLISPLGDLLRRRQLMMLLVFVTLCLSIGLAVTTSIRLFKALCFLVGVVNVTPQILLPFAADLAPPARRASTVSIVQTGLMLGILIARVIAGVIGNFTSWRVVYYVAVGIQAVVLCGLYWIIPDYPAKNGDISYLAILRSMAKFAITEPMLIQAALVNLASMACWSNFWVTLTFLLSSEPYHYSTLVIGLFGLLGIFGVSLGPLVGRIIDRLVPWYATLIATVLLLVLQAIETAAGGVNIAAVVVFCIGIDALRQVQTVSLSSAIFSISISARSRLNAVLTLSLFVGQVMGSSVGSKVFLEYGWRASSILSMAWYAWQLFVIFLRGPNCRRYTWLGYEGGLAAKKGERSVSDQETTEIRPVTVSPSSDHWQLFANPKASQSVS